MKKIVQTLKTRDVDGIPGLISVIAQDSKTNEVLMIGYANKEAIERTLETRIAHYFSTSRKKIWLKGEISGHTQNVKEIYIDCDNDALLFKVEQKGGACHEGYKTCFFRKLEDNEFKIVKNKIFEPDEVY